MIREKMRHGASRVEMLLGALFLLMGSWGLSAMDIEQRGRELVIRTRTLQAVIRDCAIVHVADAKGTCVFADRQLDERCDTAGLGNMTGNAYGLSSVHRKYADEHVVPMRPLGRIPIYRRPSDQSKLTLARERGRAIVTWKGLTNGEARFPDDFIRLILRETSTGALGIQAQGSSAEAGVFTVQVPLENLRKEGNFVLPSFGGMLYRGASEKRGLMTLMMDSLYYDAPVMTMECEGHSLGLWNQDGSFRQVFAFLRRGVKSNSFALEMMNPMPFEEHRDISVPEMYVNVFPDSGWIAAARPYRDWYQGHFAEEIAIRDNNFSKDIHLIMNSHPAGSNHVLASQDWPKLVKEFGAEHLLFTFWHLRKYGFDQELPDYTPHKAGVEVLKELRRRGVTHIGGYFNPLCVCYNRPCFKRDNLRSFVLTRRNTIDNYNAGQGGAIPEYLGGTVDGGTKDNRFAGIKDGRLIYLDPLSAAWRIYISDTAEKFRKDTGIDFFYLDCLGVVNDPGNGAINGYTGAEGIVKLAQGFLQRFRMPFVTEYGSAPIAFATKWPLVCPNRHAEKAAFYHHRLHNQRPLSAFLFGYRPHNFLSLQVDRQLHMATAISDTTSGLGHVRTNGIDLGSGFDDHLYLRTQVYVKNRLTPYYPAKNYPKHILAMYKDQTGKIFQYYDDGYLQKMMDPQGEPLYGRLDGKTHFSGGSLLLPFWPLRKGQDYFGLDPLASYALFPKSMKPRVSKIAVTSSSRPVRLKAYYEADHYTYLKLDGMEKTTGTVDFRIDTDPRYKESCVNGIWQKVSDKTMKVTATLPVCIIFSDGREAPAEQFRYIQETNGLEFVSAKPLGKPSYVYKGRQFYSTKSAHSVILDGLYQVRHPDDTLDFLTQNREFGTGLSNASKVSILLNGQVVKAYDAAPKRNPNSGWGKHGIKHYLFDYDLHHWRIPLGRYVGQKLLITIKIDNKGSDYDDFQVVTKPEFRCDPSQQARFEKTSENVPPFAYQRFGNKK